MKFAYNFPAKLNIPNLPFRSLANPIVRPQGQSINDGFATNPLYDKFGTKAEIETAVKNNPRIK